MPTTHAIDVSHWNGYVNWAAVKRSGVEIGCCKATQGTYRIDPRFVYNRNNMRFHMKQRIWYHFLTAEKPLDQVTFFLKVVGPMQDNEGVMLDVEPLNVLEDRTWKTVIPELPVEHIDQVLKYLQYFTGTTPFLYIGRYYTGATDQRLAKWPWWLPWYRATPPPISITTRKYVIWQFTGSGKQEGVDGDCDLNQVMNFDVFNACLKQATIEPEPEPEPEPDTDYGEEEEDMTLYFQGNGKAGDDADPVHNGKAVWAWTPGSEGGWVSKKSAALLDAGWPEWRSKIKVIDQAVVDAWVTERIDLA